MQRRDLIKVLGGGAIAAACPFCVAGARAEGAHWEYSGDRTSMTWAGLDPANKVCMVGAEQSPINLVDGKRADLAPLLLDYKKMPLRIVNNGHTVQVNTEPGSTMRLDGAVYGLIQFHFHHPSEHLLSGRALDMELHFVHKHPSGNLAVLGVFLQSGRPNAAIEKIFKLMPSSGGPEQSFPDEITLTELLPELGRYYRYQGSLTTPPCAETVTWTVLKQPLEVSPQQIATFAKLYSENARPVAPINRRFLLERS